MRFVFHCRNTTGLGHLMRGRNIAAALQKLAPSAEIIFTGNRESVAPLLVEFPYHPHLGTTRIAALHPSVIILDTLFPNWRVPERIPIAYVMRRMKREMQNKVLENPLLARINLVLIPHDQNEFPDQLPIAMRQKTIWTGPIVRETSFEKQSILREKYNIQETHFVIISTAGGGGKREESLRFFGIVSALHERLRGFIPNLRHIVVLGPYSTISLTAQQNMTVLKFEPEMHNFFGLANLVIGEGGYNTANEIRQAKIPAVFIPSSRKHDDQQERVRMLEKMDFCEVFTSEPMDAVVDGILKLCLAGDRLTRMKKKLLQDSFETGNVAAAAKILELVHRFPVGLANPLKPESWERDED